MLPDLILAIICGFFIWVMFCALLNMLSHDSDLEAPELLLGLGMSITFLVLSGWGFFHFLNRFISEGC